MGAVSVFKVGNYHDQPQVFLLYVSRKEVARPSIEQRNSRQLQKDFIEEIPEVGRGSSRF